LAAIVSSALALAVPSLAGAAEPDVVKLGSANGLTFFIGQEKEFCSEQNLKVEIVRFPSSDETCAAHLPQAISRWRPSVSIMRWRWPT
jgi:ABC-type nitrate/sulfonate/bicarbonate transport system substrate-binding protein